ncbi:MAG TPA: protease pro-enzyme activation domain-containing protein, partial [Acidisarcina sp.]
MDPKKAKLTRSITSAKKTTPKTGTGSKPAAGAARKAATQGKPVELKGTHRVVVTGAKAVKGVDPKEQATVTLRLKRKASGDFDKMLTDLMTQPIAERRYLTQDQLAAAHGAAQESVAKVDAFAHAHNLTVVETSLPKRSIKLQGSLADLQNAFGVTLKMFKSKNVSYRGRVGSIFIPKDLATVVEGVFGLDNRPAAKSHIHFGAAAAIDPAKKKKKPKPPKPSPNPSPSPVEGPFTAPEVAALYNFPKQLTGKGQTIALIELNTPNDPSQPTQNVGAGYVLSDINSYFKALGLTPPQITAISVDGGANLPNLNLNADGEVELDIEVMGAIAPGANIAVYFAPNTDQGF